MLFLAMPQIKRLNNSWMAAHIQHVPSWQRDDDFSWFLLFDKKPSCHDVRTSFPGFSSPFTSQFLFSLPPKTQLPGARHHRQTPLHDGSGG
jgi:hypothetical protein